MGGNIEIIPQPFSDARGRSWSARAKQSGIHASAVHGRNGTHLFSASLQIFIPVQIFLLTVKAAVQLSFSSWTCLKSPALDSACFSISDEEWGSVCGWIWQWRCRCTVCIPRPLWKCEKFEIKMCICGWICAGAGAWLVHCSAGSDQRMQINVPYGRESAKLVANHNFSHRQFKYISIDETG